MHPVLGNIRSLAWYALVWLFAGVLIAKLIYFTGRGDWTQAFAFAIPLTLVYGFINLSAYYVSRSSPLASERRLRVVLTALFNAMLTACFWLALAMGWNVILHEWQTAIVMDTGTTMIMIVVGTVLYLLSIAIYYVMMMARQAEQAKQNELQSAVLSRDAELRMLRAQIDPHFLFNSLNSISALTHSDPDGARRMTVELAAFFRQTLALAQKPLITLREEWNLCEHFLSVEKVRFGNRLTVEMMLPEQLYDILLPPMLIQPLAENAVKHGIAQCVEGGTIRIYALTDGPYAHIVIENPMEDESSYSEGTHIGLGNIRKRIQNQYGRDARLTTEKQNRLFVAKLSIPVSPGEVSA